MRSCCFGWFCGSFSPLGLIAASSGAVAPTFAQAKPSQDYLVYVLSEAADKISLVRFGPNGARVDHDLTTGGMPADIDGPHGIAISSDKQFYYVSLTHGRPFSERISRYQNQLIEFSKQLLRTS